MGKIRAKPAFLRTASSARDAAESFPMCTRYNSPHREMQLFRSLFLSDKSIWYARLSQMVKNPKTSLIYAGWVDNIEIMK